jgi:hypothetical protein
MSLDEQLAELLAQLGVVLEDPAEERAPSPPAARSNSPQRRGASAGVDPDDPDDPDDPEETEVEDILPFALEGDGTVDDEARGEAEMSLFQSSREHYGVFYRLDLVAGAPQLRVFLPESQGAIKMRCYLVRASIGSPVRDWFLSTRTHDGSSAYAETRELTEQHLLFAAGESLKRLFWLGEPDVMQFPPEIEVERLL